MREEHRQRLMDKVLALEDTARYIDENQMANLEHQEGKRMLAAEFERRICKLSRDLVFDTRELTDAGAEDQGLPKGSSIRSICKRLPSGKLQYVASYPYLPYLPEYTIILMKKVRKPTTGQNYSRHDFPAAEKVMQEDGTWKWQHKGPTPFDQFVDEPCGKIPGWRSALLLLVFGGFVTASAVEREFGSSDRATWAQKLGKQKIAGLGV